MSFLVRTVPMILVMGTIFFLSHQSGDTLKLPSFPGADKLAHLLAYGVLALTVFWYHGEKGLDSPLRSAATTVLICVLYGVSDEFHQSFVALRSVSALDLLADGAGALCVTVVWLRSRSLRTQIVVPQKRVMKKFSL